jgi:flavorubredoxin
MNLSPSASPVVEGRLLRLGGLADLARQVSWAPLSPGEFQPINCYVIFDQENIFMVDTGVPAHRDIIIRQLDDIGVTGKEISLFLTRAEYETIGNLEAIHNVCSISEISVGGIRNPFDGYEEMTKTINTREKRLHAGENGIANLSMSGSLKIIPTRIKILHTNWLYDEITKTLFSSDIFGHTSIGADVGAIVISRDDEDLSTIETSRNHLIQKYHWLEFAETKLLSEWLEKLFSDLDIENIAPTHGCVLKGKGIVDRHYRFIQSILHEFDNERRS